MNTVKKLSEIINMLDIALAESDWDAVDECITELNFLNEELQSTFPYEFGESFGESEV